MDWKKIAPWNWFQDEQARASATLPARAEATAEPFVSLRREMARAFDEVFSRAFPTGLSPFAGALPAPTRPSVDISEGKKAYTVRADLPGVALEDVSIEVEANTLAIRAEKQRETEQDEEDYHCVERSYGLAQRVLSLPENADPEAIEATFRDGVLELRIPKHPALASGARSIEVRRG